MDEINDKVRVYTADDEEPDCMTCDNMCAPDKFCTNCGKTFWSGYKRTEFLWDGVSMRTFS